MTEGPNDIMVVLILAGVVLFVLAAGLADLSDGFKRFLSSRRRRRRELQLRRSVGVDPVDPEQDRESATAPADEPEQL